MEPSYERLMRLIAEARKRQGLERPIDLIRASGLSKSTVHRLDTGQVLGESALRAVSKAVGWTPDSAATVLAGGEPTEADPADASVENLENRYRREPLPEGEMVAIYKDMVYEALIAADPNASLKQLDAARKAAFKVLHRNGIAVALRHTEESQGTETGP
jgi:hypothetical protein